jgi:hypothetical protein
LYQPALPLNFGGRAGIRSGINLEARGAVEQKNQPHRQSCGRRQVLHQEDILRFLIVSLE